MVDTDVLRVVFFGTPEFAVSTLDALLLSRHSVVGVVTRQDRPRGRGHLTSDTAVKAMAVTANLPVLQPERTRDAEFLAALRDLAADVFVVAAYGKLLAPPVLEMPRLGALNVHASLLPRYRGAAPIHRAVIDGETETGVTIIRLVTALDAGPMLASLRRPIGPDETSVDVERELAPLGAILLVSTLDALASGPLPETPQDHEAATYAPRLSKDEGNVDWTKSSHALHNLIRGLHPWPHAFTYHRGKRLILHRSVVKARPEALPDVPPGTVVASADGSIDIVTGDGVLGITELQPEGRRLMTAKEFLAGYPIAAGDVMVAARP